MTHLPSEQDPVLMEDDLCFCFSPCRTGPHDPVLQALLFLSRTIQGLSTLFCRLLYHILSLSLSTCLSLFLSLYLSLSLPFSLSLSLPISLYLSLSLPFSLSLSTYLSPSSSGQLPIHFPSLSYPHQIDLDILFAVLLLPSSFFLYLILE